MTLSLGFLKLEISLNFFFLPFIGSLIPFQVFCMLLVFSERNVSWWCFNKYCHAFFLLTKIFGCIFAVNVIFSHLLLFILYLCIFFLPCHTIILRCATVCYFQLKIFSYKIANVIYSLNYQVFHSMKF